MPSEIYVNAARQISLQEPLTDSWIESARICDLPYSRSVDPDFRRYFAPMKARRMGRLLKRAVICSNEVIGDSGIAMPDAIITGTGLGCVESTEAFLTALSVDGEELLNPTHFMQSTHNTIGSHISIHTANHGYNSTYSHKALSFESALFDAWLQLRLGHISSALVGGHDEMTPSYFSLLKKAGFVGQPGQVTAAEASASLMVSTRAEGALCRLETVEMLYAPSAEALREALERIDPQAVMTGVNGNAANDRHYAPAIDYARDKRLPALTFKNIFGECFTASALGAYAAVVCLARDVIPAAMLSVESAVELSSSAPERIALVTHSDGKNFSIISFSKT